MDKVLRKEISGVHIVPIINKHRSYLSPEISNFARYCSSMLVTCGEKYYTGFIKKFSSLSNSENVSKID